MGQRADSTKGSPAGRLGFVDPLVGDHHLRPNHGIHFLGNGDLVDAVDHALLRVVRHQLDRHVDAELAGWLKKAYDAA